MITIRALLALSVFSTSSLVMASGAGDGLYERTIQNSEKYVQEYAASRGKVSPEVIVYRYGMKLDIAKVGGREN